MINILEKLSEIGIPAVSSKGPIIAETLYNDITLRTFSGINIFIPKSQIDKAKKIIHEAGFKKIDRNISHFLKKEYRRLKYHEEFIKHNNNTILELHWDLSIWRYISGLNPEKMLVRFQNVNLFGRETLTFHPEDLFFILCLHGARYRWNELKWICDIAEFVRMYHELNWGKIIITAEIHGMKRIVLLGLYLAKNLLNAELPGCILEQINLDPFLERLTRKIYKELFDEKRTSISFFQNPLFQILLKEKNIDKMRYVIRSI